MIVVRANEVAGKETDLPHRRTLKVLLSPTMQEISNGLGMGLVIIPPDQSSSPHLHEYEQEVWYVISGQGVFRIGEEEIEVGPDTVVVSPPGIMHQIVSSTKSELKALFIFTPAGPETQYLPNEDEN